MGGGEGGGGGGASALPLEHRLTAPFHIPATRCTASLAGRGRRARGAISDLRRSPAPPTPSVGRYVKLFGLFLRFGPRLRPLGY